MSATDEVHTAASVEDPRTPTLHPSIHTHHAIAPPHSSHHQPLPYHHQPRLPPCHHPDSIPTPLPPPPPPTRAAVTSTPQDTDMADWDVCENDGVASMHEGDTELAAHATPTVNMDAIEARSDISGAAPWPKRRPRHDMCFGAEAAAPLARQREEGTRAEAVAAAPLARPREEETRADTVAAASLARPREEEARACVIV